MGVLGDLSITKMVPQDTKINPQDVKMQLPGLPKRCSGYPKWNLKVSKITILSINSDPFQQSTGQQLPASKGAGGRGEALTP